MSQPKEWDSLFSYDEFEIAVLKYGAGLQNRMKIINNGDDCIKVTSAFVDNIKKAGFKLIGTKFNDNKVEVLYIKDMELV